MADFMASLAKDAQADQALTTIQHNAVFVAEYYRVLIKNGTPHELASLLTQQLNITYWQGVFASKPKEAA